MRDGNNVDISKQKNGINFVHYMYEGMGYNQKILLLK